MEQKNFITADGTLLGQAIVPEGYTAEGYLDTKWQSEMVPFNAFYRSVAPDNALIMAASSKDIHADLRSPLLKGVAALVQQHTSAGYDAYVDEDTYMQNFAESFTGVRLELTDIGDLPSVLAADPDSARALLHYDKELYDMFFEIGSSVVSEEVGSKLYRYTGKQEDTDIVVLAGADLQRISLTYSPSFLNGASERISKAMEIAKERFGYKGDSTVLSDLKTSVGNVLSGKEKMTFDDYMKGGLLGKMMREKKNTPKEEEKPAVKEETKEEKKERADLVLYGSQKRYICLCRADREREATEIFLTFMRSLSIDTYLSQKESDAISQKMNLIRQQAAANQSIALQKTAQLRAMQARTSQMISENSRRASEGLMDSWNRKMASDSHISQSYSEAIRGVDTYTNSYGQNVEVSVAADHVYENRYGDMTGVSGNALDESLLNSLNWKKVK